MAHQHWLPDFEEGLIPWISPGVTGTFSSDYHPVCVQPREDPLNGIGILSQGFNRLLLRPALIQAAEEVGMDLPTPVQQRSIPPALLGGDIICCAGPCTGRTTALVLACLELLPLPTTLADDEVLPQVLALCPDREHVHRLRLRFEEIAKYLGPVRICAVSGEVPVALDHRSLQDQRPHIVIGTPGRVLALLRARALQLQAVIQIAVSSCQRCIGDVSMRRDVSAVFSEVCSDRQVLMFGDAGISKEVRQHCEALMNNPQDVSLPEEPAPEVFPPLPPLLHAVAAVTATADTATMMPSPTTCASLSSASEALAALPEVSCTSASASCMDVATSHVQHHRVHVAEQHKCQKLMQLLDDIDFHQAVVFAKSSERAAMVEKFLTDSDVPALLIDGEMNSTMKAARFAQFLDFQKRILVSTDLALPTVQAPAVSQTGGGNKRVLLVVSVDAPRNSRDYKSCLEFMNASFPRSGIVSVVFAAGNADISSIQDCGRELEKPFLELEIAGW